MSSSKSESLFQSYRPTSRVAIIGRPNVGKSTLFNYLTESRKAVVKNQPGVTRDIQIEPAEIWGVKFDVIDTGGLTEATDLFSQLIREQVVEFLSSVDHLIVVMDGRAGLLPEDRDIVRIAIEAGVTGYWYRYVGLDGAVVGIDSFGASAPAEKLFPHFGFTVERIVELATAL